MATLLQLFALISVFFNTIVATYSHRRHEHGLKITIALTLQYSPNLASENSRRQPPPQGQYPPVTTTIFAPPTLRFSPVHRAPYLSSSENTPSLVSTPSTSSDR
ncbi:hypothetical protein Acr_13g0011470 [Actinidia rufa]|uniref:Secreted protein n=1 Tax=Actinidia rufa TaxID=165716 RepID=A0A7J0FP86_9ERIC|nr:hypothetical protein Acr_13g0011470 [Actinidia rufa]